VWMCVCVRECVRTYAHVCMCVRMCVRVYTCSKEGRTSSTSDLRGSGSTGGVLLVRECALKPVDA